MTGRTIPLVAVFAMCVVSSVRAQARTDFAGRWSSAPPPAAPPARDVASTRGTPAPSPDLGSGWGRSITIAQTDRTLTVEWPYFTRYDLQPPLRFVFALDGSETVNTVSLGRGIQRQRSRVRWAGSSLVIVTVHRGIDATGRPIETEVRQTLTLESPTSLVIEMKRGATGDAPEATSRTVYTKETG